MSVCISTMGKFCGPPTRKASAVYGGGTSGGIQYVDKHKFPVVRVSKVESDNNHINITVTEVKEID